MAEYFYQHDFEEVNRNYNEESLLLLIEYVESKVKNATEYLEALKRQLEVVKQTQFKHEIYFCRRKEYDGRVKYYVGVNKIPQVEGVRPVTISSTTRVFGGKEKKQAQEYARKLAEEYGAEVVEE